MGYDHNPSGKREARIRDADQCQMCGSTDYKGLSVHHIQPRSEGGTDDVFNLITLCRTPCHDEIERLYQSKKVTPKTCLAYIEQQWRKNHDSRSSK